MREIKWRVQHAFTKEWQYHTALELEGADNAGLCWDINTISQYTGLHDKNSEEIYEGDILIVEDQYTQRILDGGSGPIEPANHLAPVVFKNGSFGVEIRESGDWFKKGFYTFKEVENENGQSVFENIGTVWENPELVQP